MHQWFSHSKIQLYPELNSVPFMKVHILYSVLENHCVNNFVYIMYLSIFEKYFLCSRNSEFIIKSLSLYSITNVNSKPMQLNFYTTKLDGLPVNSEHWSLASYYCLCCMFSLIRINWVHYKNKSF